MVSAKEKKMNTNNLKETKKTNKSISHNGPQKSLCVNCENMLRLLNFYLKSNNLTLDEARYINGIVDILKSCECYKVSSEEIDKIANKAIKKIEDTSPLAAIELHLQELTGKYKLNKSFFQKNSSGVIVVNTDKYVD